MISKVQTSSMWVIIGRKSNKTTIMNKVGEKLKILHKYTMIIHSPLILLLINYDYTLSFDPSFNKLWFSFFKDCVNE